MGQVNIAILIFVLINGAFLWEINRKLNSRERQNNGYYNITDIETSYGSFSTMIDFENFWKNWARRKDNNFIDDEISFLQRCVKNTNSVRQKLKERIVELEVRRG